MYNLLIAAGAAVVSFLAGWAAVSWIAGFVPAILAFVIVWVLLARRTGKQVEALFQAAMQTLQAGKIDEARAMLEAAMPLGKWQILVTQQIHSQLGALDYLQGVGHTVQRQASAAKARYASAREHLEKAWSRDWRAKATLAAIHHREGRPDDAVKVLEAASGVGKGETIFWALYTYVLNEARRRDEALQVVGRGLQENKDSKPLKEIQAALANKTRPNMRVMGEPWYQFFPEDIPREQVMQMQGITNKPRPQKSWPQPRR
jgi:tetratricopeptide (TPR) repeat protein